MCGPVAHQKRSLLYCDGKNPYIKILAPRLFFPVDLSFYNEPPLIKARFRIPGNRNGDPHRLHIVHLHIHFDIRQNRVGEIIRRSSQQILGRRLILPAGPYISDPTGLRALDLSGSSGDRFHIGPHPFYLTIGLDDHLKRRIFAPGDCKGVDFIHEIAPVLEHFIQSIHLIKIERRIFRMQGCQTTEHAAKN